MDALIKKIIEKDYNPTVVGLDPKLDYVPEFIKASSFEKYTGLTAAADALWEFNRALIDSMCDIIAAVKPQSAYYEMYGIEGLRTMQKTIDYAREKGLYVILDVKRGDIGATASAYSAAYLGSTSVNGGEYRAFSPDAVTVNPYLGTDGIKPFTADCEKYDKDIFVLVKTSNASSGELQDLKAEGGTIYEKTAALVNGEGSSNIGEYGYSRVGAVVGATYPKQIEILRGQMKNTFFLVPGYGAQGGTAEDVAAAFDSRGLGAVVNSSRGIMCAYKKTGADERDFAAAAKEEALRMKEEFSRCINRR